MKYALTFFFYLSFFVTSHAQAISSFKDSNALITVTTFMFDSSEDLPNPIKLSDKKIAITSTFACEFISAEKVLAEVSRAIISLAKFYPDEDLPYEEALSDLRNYLNNQTFKKCLMEKVTPHSRTLITYFFDQNDQIHVRLDTNLN